MRKSCSASALHSIFMPGGVAKRRVGCSALASNGCSDYVRSRNGSDAVTCTTILVLYWKSSRRKPASASIITTDDLVEKDQTSCTPLFILSSVGCESSRSCQRSTGFFSFNDE